MIHEEIVTYEVAKLAKEKGFNEKTPHYYETNCVNPTAVEHCRGPQYFNKYQTATAAPTQSLLQRWLRDIKEVDIIVPCIDGKYNYVVQGNINYKCVYDEFSSYELALEDALKYALENLV